MATEKEGVRIYRSAGEAKRLVWNTNLTTVAGARAGTGAGAGTAAASLCWAPAAAAAPAAALAAVATRGALAAALALVTRRALLAGGALFPGRAASSFVTHCELWIEREKNKRRGKPKVREKTLSEIKDSRT